MGTKPGELVEEKTKQCIFEVKTVQCKDSFDDFSPANRNSRKISCVPDSVEFVKFRHHSS